MGIFAVHVNTQNPEKIGSRGKWLDSGGSESTVATRCAVMSINTKRFKTVCATVQYSACRWQGTH